MIRGKRIKAKRKNRKRHSVVRRKDEKIKEKRSVINNCAVAAGHDYWLIYDKDEKLLAQGIYLEQEGP